MTTNGHGTELGTLPTPGARYRLRLGDDGHAPAELLVQEVAPGDRIPVRGVLTYYPDHAGHPKHGNQPYRCDVAALDELWRAV